MMRLYEDCRTVDPPNGEGPAGRPCGYCAGAGEVSGLADDVELTFACACNGGSEEAVRWLLGAGSGMLVALKIPEARLPAEGEPRRPQGPCCAERSGDKARLRELYPDVRYCPWCGAKLADAERVRQDLPADAAR
jgi:hypothetical protein